MSGFVYLFLFTNMNISPRDSTDHYVNILNRNLGIFMDLKINYLNL